MWSSVYKLILNCLTLLEELPLQAKPDKYQLGTKSYTLIAHIPFRYITLYIS